MNANLMDLAEKWMSCLQWAPHLNKQRQDNSGLKESKVLAKAVARALDEGHKLRRRSTASAASFEPARQQAEALALLPTQNDTRLTAGCTLHTMKGRMSSLKLPYSPPG